MKIKIEAYLYAPGILQTYSGINPIIATGFFQKQMSVKDESVLKYRHTITIKRIVMNVGKIKKHNGKRTLICNGQLPSVSVKSFKILEQRGWIINKEAASQCGFPNNKKDKYLREEIQKIKESQIRRMKAKKKLVRDLKVH
jgi:hypothetical protein